MFEDFKVKHRLDEFVIKAYHAILSVLAYTRCYEDLLLLQIDIRQANVCYFVWSDKGVVGKLAQEQKVRVLFLEILLELSDVGYAQGCSLLFVFL